MTHSESARCIGAEFNETMSMKGHIAHLREIRMIRQYLDSSSSATLKPPYVTKQQIDMLQHNQNDAADVVIK